MSSTVINDYSRLNTIDWMYAKRHACVGAIVWSFNQDVRYEEKWSLWRCKRRGKANTVVPGILLSYVLPSPRQSLQVSGGFYRNMHANRSGEPDRTLNEQRVGL